MTSTENTEITSERLRELIGRLPGKPGVYLYKNSGGTIIYVGKAKNLRSRVRSYFQRSNPGDAKTQALISHIADMEYFLVDSEAEALILEDTLIKKHKPKYNILLRDDKSYPYIKITKDEYPKIYITRNLQKDGSKYFGPFTEVRNIKGVLKMLRTIFMFRTCDLNITADSIEKKKHKICLDYHIKKCEGPCEGLISQIEYNRNIKLAVQILNGRTSEAEKQLEAEMLTLSEEMKFEEAAVLRNRIQLLREYSSKQKIVSQDQIDRDVFAIAIVDKYACSIVFKIREGKLIGKRHYIVKNVDYSEIPLILRRTIETWYLENEFVPKELFLPEEPDDLEYLTDWLGKRRGKPLQILIPKIGDKRDFVKMAETNAEFILKEYLASIERRDQVIPKSLTSLQRDLRLNKAPRRIECFDNSHFQGTDYVSSLVVFQDGKPKKSEYRKFKMREVTGNDDFAAMREVVRRRYTRLKDEAEAKADKTLFPDLIIVDGGKGQLSSAAEILKELNLSIPIIGIAKRLEEIFLPGVKEPILLPKTSSSLKLIQQLRDEAHRFAITFHRKLRDKRTFTTELTSIAGIGKRTAEKLLIEFGSVETIKNADIELLSKFVPRTVAQSILEYFGEGKE